jgi:hypothetical protein
MSAQLPSPRTEPWPETTVARYLTVAGATVDVTATTEPDKPYAHDYGNGVTGRPEECIKLTLLAACTACKDHDENEYDGLFATVMDRLLESPYGRTAQGWAQAHAEKCRALPRPAATQ